MTSRYDLNWRDSMRLRNGMKWAGATPTIADYPQSKTYAIRLCIVAALWGWAMDQDFIAQQATAQTSAEIRAERAEKMLADCMNGRAAWVTEDGRAMVACDKAWSTKL